MIGGEQNWLSILLNGGVENYGFQTFGWISWKFCLFLEPSTRHVQIPNEEQKPDTTWINITALPMYKPEKLHSLYSSFQQQFN
jgi:hypothetical protein